MFWCLSLLDKHFKFYLHKHNFVRRLLQFSQLSQLPSVPFICFRIVANKRNAQNGRCHSCALSPSMCVSSEQTRGICCVLRTMERGREGGRGRMCVCMFVWAREWEWQQIFCGFQNYSSLGHFEFARRRTIRPSAGSVPLHRPRQLRIFLLTQERNEHQFIAMMVSHYTGQNWMRTRAYLFNEQVATFSGKMEKCRQLKEKWKQTLCAQRLAAAKWKFVPFASLSSASHRFSIDFSPSSCPSLCLCVLCAVCCVYVYIVHEDFELFFSASRPRSAAPRHHIPSIIIIIIFSHFISVCGKD